MNLTEQIDWQKHKAIAIKSDDWGDCEFCPTREAFCELVQTHPFMKDPGYRTPNGMTPFALSTLESPGEMKNLFQILLKYKGGDNRPVVFTPLYMGGCPDFEAIEKNNFSSFVYLGIDKGVPSLWERGDFIAKAREGIKLGIWYPEMELPLHHFRPEPWMKALREGDDLCHRCFSYQAFNTYRTYPENLQVKERTVDEFDKELAAGVEALRNCFGYYPHTFDGLAGEAEPGDEQARVLVKNHIRLLLTAGVKSNSKGEYDYRDPVRNVRGFNNKVVYNYDVNTGLHYLANNCNFEPYGYAEDYSTGWIRAYETIEKRFGDNEPVVMLNHRINYVSFSRQNVETNLVQLNKLLSRIQHEHPEAVYVTLWELAQLCYSGVSTINFGDSLICRNYTSEIREIETTIEAGKKIKSVKNLRSSSEVSFDFKKGTLRLEIGEGDYIVELIP